MAVVFSYLNRARPGLLISYVFGFLTGLGFLVSGVLRPSKVLGFFTLTSARWDPTILIVMVTIILMNAVTFMLIYQNPAPMEEELRVYVNHREVDVRKRVAVGSALLGIGWGLTGFCPGTAMPGFFIYSDIIGWVGGFLIGRIIVDALNATLLKEANHKETRTLLINP